MFKDIFSHSFHAAEATCEIWCFQGGEYDVDGVIGVGTV
jgi:hypothetical protein